MLKGNVPIFNESVDLTDPKGSAISFANMAVGVSIAIAAYGVGQRLYDEIAARTPADDVEVF